jgi:hypothetical protein
MQVKPEIIDFEVVLKGIGEGGATWSLGIGL